MPPFRVSGPLDAPQVTLDFEALLKGEATDLLLDKLHTVSGEVRERVTGIELVMRRGRVRGLRLRPRNENVAEVYLMRGYTTIRDVSGNTFSLKMAIRSATVT